ncbi:hypothetical protein AK812_SmicGene32794 [Symbiodinium microadriaticum]|uniref:Uncharacterized protein n=1 Tax=Symbiodinium microadriaticum TaxID=2951 RepID=A0A1Q9CT64_SYMMI|nr:hypothetical protein AK812_SmicGene32794 [Symbiodinium microadriaticum]
MDSEDLLARLRRLEEKVAKTGPTSSLPESRDSNRTRETAHSAALWEEEEPIMEVLAGEEFGPSFAARLARLETLMASMPQQLETLHRRIDGLVLTGAPTLGTPGERPKEVRMEDIEGHNPAASIAGATEVLASATSQFTALHQELTKIRQESEREEREEEEEAQRNVSGKQTRFMLMPGSMSLTIVPLGKRLFRLGTGRLDTSGTQQYSPSVYSLPSSCWGALPLLGLQEFGSTASGLTLLGAALAALVQLLFCSVLFHGLLDTPRSPVDESILLDWRLLGHSAAFYDPVSKTSLAGRLCRNGHFGLGDVIEEVRGFLQPALAQLSVGVLLSSMAVLIWACYVTIEVEAVFSLVRAIHKLPPKTTVLEQAEGYLSFRSISDERRLGVSFLLFCRSGVLLILGFSGGVWLSRLQDVGGILHDCVMLVMILGLDEVAYKLLVPRPAKTYAGAIRTFMFQDGHKTNAGCTLAALGKLGALVLSVAFLITFGCLHSGVVADEVRDVLCGGNVDFVTSLHPSLGLPIVLDTESYDSVRAEQIRSWASSYVPQPDQAFFNVTLPQGTVAVRRVGSYEELQAYLALTDREASEQGFGTGCQDLGRDSPEGAWLWPALAAAGASNCQQAYSLCDRRDLPLARMLCPETCGCLDSASGLYVSNGCRQLCHQELDTFNESLRAMPCEDLRAQGDYRRTAWSRWWAGFYQAHDNDSTVEESMIDFARNGAQGDCSFLNTQDAIRDRFCRGGSDRPGTAICPVTCGCASGTTSDWCPSSC